MRPNPLAVALQQQVQSAVAAELATRAAALEALCVEAFWLQRLDRVDRLTVLHRPGVPPTVASLLVVAP